VNHFGGDSPILIDQSPIVNPQNRRSRSSGTSYRVILQQEFWITKQHGKSLIKHWSCQSRLLATRTRLEATGTYEVQEASELGPGGAFVDCRNSPGSDFTSKHLGWFTGKRSPLGEIQEPVVRMDADTQLDTEVDFLRQAIWTVPFQFAHGSIIPQTNSLMAQSRDSSPKRRE
jgi:hypothetical protein